jgi:leucyl-tRNA synthetase
VDEATPSDKELMKLLNKTVKKVSGDTATMNYNTAIAQMMVYSTELGKLERAPRALFEPLVLMLGPYAPHLAEELWEKLGHKESIAGSSRAGKEIWPAWDESLCADDEKEIVVQVNGKIREKFVAAVGTPEEALKARGLALPKVQEWMAGKEVAKVIVVKDKLVNIVVKG